MALLELGSKLGPMRGTDFGSELSALAPVAPKWEPAETERPSVRLRKSQMRVWLKAGKDGYSVGA